MVGWINRVMTNEESPEAKLLRQRISYVGLVLVFAAAVGLMPVYGDWTLPVWNAIVVGIFGFVLIVIDMVQTVIGLKMTGTNEPVNVAKRLIEIEDLSNLKDQVRTELVDALRELAETPPSVPPNMGSSSVLEGAVKG